MRGTEERAGLLGQGRRENSFKVWASACHTDATLGEDGLCVACSILSYWLPDGYLWGDARSPPRELECKDKIRTVQEPHMAGTRVSLGSSFGWISR